jgi:hypothetical protein
MPESVCLSMILENALGRSLSPSSNSSWCICFTDPCGSRPRRKPIADKRTLRPGTYKFAPVAAVKLMQILAIAEIAAQVSVTNLKRLLPLNSRGLWTTSKNR